MKRFASLRKKHIALGRQGENFAADYLERNGFTILARNWRTEAGELDIVAWNGSELHFESQVGVGTTVWFDLPLPGDKRGKEAADEDADPQE